MWKSLGGCVAILAALFGATAAAAEPIRLHLAYWSSDRSAPYLGGIKPFLEAVNAEAKDLLEIQLHPSGELRKNIALQPQLVLDGGADLTLVVAGYTPQIFSDNVVIEFPGLFRDSREASYSPT